MLLNKSLCKSLWLTRTELVSFFFFVFRKNILDPNQTRKEIINFRRCTALLAVIIRVEKKREKKREQRKSYPR